MQGDRHHFTVFFLTEYLENTVQSIAGFILTNFRFMSLYYNAVKWIFDRGAYEKENLYCIGSGGNPY